MKQRVAINSPHRHPDSDLLMSFSTSISIILFHSNNQKNFPPLTMPLPSNHPFNSEYCCDESCSTRKSTKTAQEFQHYEKKVISSIKKEIEYNQNQH